MLLWLTPCYSCDRWFSNVWPSRWVFQCFVAVRLRLLNSVSNHAKNIQLLHMHTVCMYSCVVNIGRGIIIKDAQICIIKKSYVKLKTLLLERQQ
uniref:Uncharacterized protein n=1 Tax=Rhipicephalus zambeziensis TaxID=60191 RepID=A0A224YHX8_9ACAR